MSSAFKDKRPCKKHCSESTVKSISESTVAIKDQVQEMRKDVLKMKQTADSAMRCLATRPHQTHSLVSHAPVFGWSREFIVVDNESITPELRRALEFGSTLDEAHDSGDIESLLVKDEVQEKLDLLKEFIKAGNYAPATGGVYCYVTHVYSFALGL